MTMESLSIVLSSSLPIQNHSKTPQSTTCKSSSHQSHFPFVKVSTPHSHLPLLRNPLLTTTSVSFTAFQLYTSLPSLASETLISQTEQVSDKIDLESILVSVDDFFNRNPFFVAGCTFIWLVVIPLTQLYLRKYKYISAIDAFRKLRDNPETQLLDIRDRKSLVALGSPNLKILNKSVVHVEFTEQDEDGFVKDVLEKFEDPASTVLCILDNFDGNSMQVAQILFKNGFKEVYAIRGGVKGKSGWLAIQETLLPPSVYMVRKRKARNSELETNGRIAQQSKDNNGPASSDCPPVGRFQGEENGSLNNSTNSELLTEIGSRSPYPNYPDLKPPSSPTPSKP